MTSLSSFFDFHPDFSIALFRAKTFSQDCQAWLLAITRCESVFTRIDIVDAHALVVLAMEFVVLVFENAREILDDVDALARTLQVGGRNGFHRAADRIHLHRLFEAHRLRLGIEGDRLRAEEHGKQHLGFLRDFRQIGHHVLGIERHENRIVDLAAELFDHRLVFLVVAVSPSIVGRDDGPVLAEIFEGPGRAGGGQCVGIRAGAEGVAGALRPRRLGGLACRKIDRLQFGCYRGSPTTSPRNAPNRR